MSASLVVCCPVTSAQAGGLAFAGPQLCATLEVYFMDSIINIVLFPFTSQTFFVVFPVCCVFVCSLFGLIRLLLRGGR